MYSLALCAASGSAARFRMFDRVIVRLVLAALLAPYAHARASAQSTSDPLTVVVVDRAMLAQANAKSGLLIILRDAELPDHPLANSGIGIGPAGAGDPRTGRGRLIGTDRDGFARFAVADTGLFTVLAMSIGYRQFQFDVRLLPDRHQTLEIYLGRQFARFHAPTPRPTQSRAVLTTCSPTT